MICARGTSAAPRTEARRGLSGEGCSAREELNYDDVGAQSAEAIRAPIDTIRLVPEQGRLEIELAGDLASVLELTSKHPRGAAAFVFSVARAKFSGHGVSPGSA